MDTPAILAALQLWRSVIIWGEKIRGRRRRPYTQHSALREKWSPPEGQSARRIMGTDGWRPSDTRSFGRFLPKPGIDGSRGPSIPSFEPPVLRGGLLHLVADLERPTEPKPRGPGAQLHSGAHFIPPSTCSSSATLSAVVMANSWRISHLRSPQPDVSRGPTERRWHPPARARPAAMDRTSSDLEGHPTHEEASCLGWWFRRPGEGRRRSPDDVFSLSAHAIKSQRLISTAMTSADRGGAGNPANKVAGRRGGRGGTRDK